jgi:hypothetical protein
MSPDGERELPRQAAYVEAVLLEPVRGATQKPDHVLGHGRARVRELHDATRVAVHEPFEPRSRVVADPDLVDAAGADEVGEVAGRGAVVSVLVDADRLDAPTISETRPAAYAAGSLSPSRLAVG